MGLGATTLHGYEYKLKVTDHRDQIHESTGRTSTYSYDGLHQMTSETITGDPAGQNGLISYGLDAVGNRTNRLSLVGIVSDQNFTYNPRNLLSSDTYDANGNTVSSQISNDGYQIEVVDDAYDFKNRLITRTDGSTTVEFLYAADGTRIGKRADDGLSPKTTFFLNDVLNPTGYSQVLEEHDAAGASLADLSATLTLNRVYTLGLDLIGYDADNGSGTWHQRTYGYDGHGSVRELLAATGSVIETYTYDAFGVLLDGAVNASDPLGNVYLYTGERFDTDLGLYYLRARYVNPGTGRFHTMDTYEGSATDPVTLHKYLYGNGNPVTFVDPSGFLALWEYALIGRYVHNYIGVDFVDIDRVNRDHNNVALRVILQDFGAVADSLLRPDLVDRRGMEMYEIKPVGRNGRGAKSAARQLAKYISTATGYGVGFVPGISYNPPTKIPNPPGYPNVTVTAWREAAGIVLYDLTEITNRNPKNPLVPLGVPFRQPSSLNLRVTRIVAGATAGAGVAIGAAIALNFSVGRGLL